MNWRVLTLSPLGTPEAKEKELWHTVVVIFVINVCNSKEICTTLMPPYCAGNAVRGRA
jgi:hypothetical protein